MKIIPEANPCKYCGGKPRVVESPGDLFYAMCKCGKWNPYEFCGATAAGTIENWNTFNIKPNKVGKKPKEKICQK